MPLNESDVEYCHNLSWSNNNILLLNIYIIPFLYDVLHFIVFRVVEFH